MKKKLFNIKSIILCLILAVSIFNTYAQSVTRLVGASPFQDSLWVFDTTSMAVLRRLAPSPSSGGPITGTNGIAKDPVSGSVYVVVKQSAIAGRMLGTIDMNTGVVNLIGNLGDNFSSITFNGNNTLLGVTGDGATVPETVYRINQNDASKTLLGSLGNGADGEIICYNPTDNMIYHWSGNGTIVYERFDTSMTTITNIPIIGTTTGETFGMVHVSGNVFIGSNISSSFNHWDTDGNVGTAYGSAPDDIRGTALITCNRDITGTLSFCTGDSTLLTMTTGGISYQWYRNGVAIAGATNQTYYATQPGTYNSLIIDMCSSIAGDSMMTGVAVQEFALPTVAVTGNSSFCMGDSALLTGTSGGTSQWYLDGSPITGATSNTYYAIASGVYNMTKTNLNGCTDSASVGVTVVVNPPPTVSLNAQNSATCVTLTTNTLTGNPPGGTFTGPGVSGNNFDPSVAGTGTHAVMYSYTDGNGCSNSDTLMITVNPLPTVSLSAQNLTSCANLTTNTLTGNPPGGTFSGPGVAGNNFDPSAAGAGTHDVMYSYVDGNGCSNSDTIVITVNPAPTVSVSAQNLTTCINWTTNTLTGNPPGGTFSGPGVAGNNFDPSAAGAGTHPVAYSYTDSTGCSNSDTIMITVDLCTGILQSSSDNKIIFTNPFSDVLNINLGNTFESGIIRIFDAMGQKVMDVNIETDHTSLSTSSLAPGVYFITITSAKGIFVYKGIKR